MKDAKTEEIRRVLLGRVAPGPDGWLIPIPKGEFVLPVGIADGAGAVRFLGMTRRVRRYGTKRGRTWVLATAGKAMEDLGRGVSLQEQPEAAACLIRYVLTRPAVLVFGYEDGAPTLTAWTGRGLTGRLSLRRAIRAFERGLPEDMTAEEVKVKKTKKKKGAEPSKTEGSADRTEK